MPVTWVVLIRAPEIFVIMAFCKPIMKHNSDMVRLIDKVSEV